MAFNWWHYIAKRICNEGAEMEQGVVLWIRMVRSNVFLRGAQAIHGGGWHIYVRWTFFVDDFRWVELTNVDRAQRILHDILNSFLWYIQFWSLSAKFRGSAHRFHRLCVQILEISEFRCQCKFKCNFIRGLEFSIGKTLRYVMSHRIFMFF